MLTQPLRVAPPLRTSLWSEYLQGPESSLSQSLSLPLKTKATKNRLDWTELPPPPLQVHLHPKALHKHTPGLQLAQKFKIIAPLLLVTFTHILSITSVSCYTTHVLTLTHQTFTHHYTVFSLRKKKEHAHNEITFSVYPWQVLFRVCKVFNIVLFIFLEIANLFNGRGKEMSVFFYPAALLLQCLMNINILIYSD